MAPKMVDNTHPPPIGPGTEMATMRILWAAHILRYLGNDCYHPRSDSVSERSQTLGIPQDEQIADSDSESPGSDLDENDALDADSERAATLLRGAQIFALGGHMGHPSII